MSMISEQVKELRYKADIYNTVGSVWELNRAEAKILQGLLRKAADTIEALSAKLTDMERSVEDCGGGWILCSERMPEENEEVICCFKSGVVKALVLFNCKFHGKVYAYEKSDIIAWQPLPEPYHEP